MCFPALGAWKSAVLSDVLQAWQRSSVMSWYGHFNYDVMCIAQAMFVPVGKDSIDEMRLSASDISPHK